MAYTLEFDLAGDNNGSGGTATAVFHIVVDGVSTNLGTKTSPTDTTSGYQWGARSFDVTSQFDPNARDVVVMWAYSSGADAARVRNVRITDGTDEWLDQWGEQGLWGSTDPWAGDGGGTPSVNDWHSFTPGPPVSMSDPFADGFVHHLIRTQTTGSWVLKFDIAPDHIATGGSSHFSRITIYIDVDGTSTYLGRALSPTEKGNDGTFEFGTWSTNVSGLFDPSASEVTVRWAYDSAMDAAHVKDLRIESFDGATVYYDQYGDWFGLVGNSYVAGDGASSPVQADPCGTMPSGTSPTLETDPYGDGFVHHLILPVFTCSAPTVGFIGLAP